MENVCIICGDPIPEGRQVCPTCERQQHGGPCQGCTKRETKCHAACQEYIAWKGYRDRVREWLRSQRHSSRMASQRLIIMIKQRARGWRRRGGNGE